MKTKFGKTIAGIALLLCAYGAGGCHGDLDIMQDNKLSASNMWKEESDATSATYGLYVYLRSALKSMNDIYLCWGELRNGLWGPGTHNTLNGVDQSQVRTSTMSSVNEYADWTALYTTVNQANLVIRHVPAMGLKEKPRAFCLGNAHFIRAYCFFQIARIWGDAPLPLWGYESTDTELFLGRTPVSEVLMRVERDIADAERYVADTSDKTVATPAAVAMLKADYALWMYRMQAGGEAYLAMAQEALGELGQGRAQSLAEQPGTGRRYRAGAGFRGIHPRRRHRPLGGRLQRRIGFRKTWEPATGENPQADGDRPVCNWTTEFNVFTGGTSAEYIESVGMKGWGLSGNTSTRPGYIKCGGGGGGIGILYTPELAALPKNTTVTVSFSASAYAEGENVYGSDIVVEAIEGAEFGSNNSVSKKGTAVASKVVDISSAVGRFETFTVTLDGLSPTSRIAFSSNPAQAGANKTRYLLDDIVVVYDGETKLEKLTVPANVKFDAEAVYSDKLTLEWDEVPGAASYTVAWWADGTEEKDATVAEGITSASYLLKELEAGTEYHAKVKACRYNNPGYDSDYSAVVSQKTDIAPVQAGIVVSKVLATSSTLTVEWARADGQACVNSSAQVYHVKLYSDAECKDLVVGWNASNVFGITAGNRFRFTFSGLAPATTYYVCVDDKTNDFFSDPLAYATAAAGPQAGATTAGSAKAGDILLAEDFSRVIHGGDIANFAAGYYPPSSNRGTYAAASGDNPSGFSATRCTANEFDVFSGGGVAAPYTEGTGLAAWGKSGNIAGRPGYVKMGAGSAAASLYTPELTALPDAATVKVRFSAQAYSEKYDGSGADAGKILVKAVRGAVLGAKGAITGTVTEVSAADPVDISAAKARFREFEATLTNVTPDCRIVISTSEKRALLDNVVVTCTAITPATKPAAPGGVSFDAAAAADRLTLKWNAVPDATSYTVAYWKGSASAPESEYAYKTGIASTATSQELTNLESNTSYWAKVKAVGSLDSDWSETANATTMDSGGEPLLPTADLLDVVFRNDGSAMDNSSSATPVRRMPSSRP